jgi:hypothetical protein
MAEWEDNRQTPQYEETVHPQNPPTSVLRPEVRRAALWLYVGPLIVITVILGIVLLYWATRDNRPNDPVEPTTGTEEATPGDFNPNPTPDSPQQEREYRGGQ